MGDSEWRLGPSYVNVSSPCASIASSLTKLCRSEFFGRPLEERWSAGTRVSCHVPLGARLSAVSCTLDGALDARGRPSALVRAPFPIVLFRLSDGLLLHGLPRDERTFSPLLVNPLSRFMDGTTRRLYLFLPPEGLSRASLALASSIALDELVLVTVTGHLPALLP